MEACPEDFIRPPGTYDPSYDSPSPRFSHITAALEGALHGSESKRDLFIHLTAEEKTALLVAYRKMSRQAFTASVIAQIFDREAKEERPKGKTGAIGAGYSHAPIKAEGARILEQDYIRREIIKQGTNVGTHK